MNFFGMITEYKNGLRPEVVIEKPGELKLLEMCEATGLPVWEGGVMDQPHIWLEQVKLVKDVRSMFERQWNNANQNAGR